MRPFWASWTPKEGRFVFRLPSTAGALALVTCSQRPSGKARSCHIGDLIHRVPKHLSYLRLELCLSCVLSAKDLILDHREVDVDGDPVALGSVQHLRDVHGREVHEALSTQTK